MSDRIITPPGRASYPNIFTPRAFNEGDEPVYSLTVVFDEDTDVSALKKQVLATAQAKWGDKLKGAKITSLDTQHGPAYFLVAGDLRVRLPWYDQPEQLAKVAEGLEGCTFIRAKNKRKPGVVTEVRDPQTGKPSVLEDESKIYPGVFLRTSLDPFAYDTKGNRGVSLSLGNIQYIGGGEALAGSYVPAEDEFEANPDAVADLSDLTEDDEEPVGVGAEGGDDLSDLIG